jgi:hypothetical protein
MLEKIIKCICGIVDNDTETVKISKKYNYIIIAVAI